VENAFIDNWEYTKFNLFNGTDIACLGGVFHNYLILCLNTFDLATTLHLGDPVRGPPFNDRCFQMKGMCGIPCVSSDNMPNPDYCLDGELDLSAISVNETLVVKTGSVHADWMTGINWVEWVVLITIFFDCFGNVLRYLPVLSGRPTELESARNCQCEGVAVMGCASPFVSEDEAIFLRGLIGRTATAFHTVGSRHNMHGLYIDTILNEKRGKGEANRRHLWLCWLEFLTLLGRIGAGDPDESDGANEEEEEDDAGLFDDEIQDGNESKSPNRKTFGRASIDRKVSSPSLPPYLVCRFIPLISIA
jgi:hypothetical protein